MLRRFCRPCEFNGARGVGVYNVTPDVVLLVEM